MKLYATTLFFFSLIINYNILYISKNTSILDSNGGKKKLLVLFTKNYLSMFFTKNNNNLETITILFFFKMKLSHQLIIHKSFSFMN